VDNKQIKELMVAMQRSGTTKMVLKKGNVELTLERTQPLAYLEQAGDFEAEDKPIRRIAPSSNAPLPKSLTTPAHPGPDTPPTEEKTGVYITSPIVGTFYASPEPEASSFVTLGTTVEKGKIVCIIEAMKVMNEVKSQVSGTVVEILVENGDPVEFGSKLFRIQPT
jgi:acetyl-CoA carboxylase biotin carboxyl carrier protein